MPGRFTLSLTTGGGPPAGPAARQVAPRRPRPLAPIQTRRRTVMTRRRRRRLGPSHPPRSLNHAPAAPAAVGSSTRPPGGEGGRGQKTRTRRMVRRRRCDRLIAAHPLRPPSRRPNRAVLPQPQAAVAATRTVRPVAAGPAVRRVVAGPRAVAQIRIRGMRRRRRRGRCGCRCAARRVRRAARLRVQRGPPRGVMSPVRWLGVRGWGGELVQVASPSLLLTGTHTFSPTHPHPHPLTLSPPQHSPSHPHLLHACIPLAGTLSPLPSIAGILLIFSPLPSHPPPPPSPRDPNFRA